MRTRKSRLVRMLALFTVLAMVLAACGGDDATEDETTTTEAASEETTTTEAASEETTTTEAMEEEDGDGEGGILRVGVQDDVQRWDSSRLQGILFPFHRNLYDTLADYVDGLNPEPMLAESWEISDTQDSITIKLREGVLFHSGREMTAEDVAANIAVFIDPDTGNQAFGPTSGAVEDWEVTGTYELVVNFQQPIAELQITDLLTGWAIGDPEFFDVYDREANGTGPFRMVEWVPGESVTLEANTDYWGEGPFIDGIEYRIFGDADAMASALEAGDIDVMYSPDAPVAQRLEGAGFTTVAAPPGAIIDEIRINPEMPPFDNVDVRQAVSYAVDLDAINEAINAGLGTVLRLPYAPTSPAYDEELAAERATDVERARELLENSGVPESEWTANLLTASNSTIQQLAGQVIQANLAEIGFTAELELVDSATRTEQLLGGDFQFLWGGIGNAQKYPTRITTNSIYRHQNNPVFDVESLIPEYTAAVEAANAAVTEEEQQAAFDELNRVLTENVWVVTGIARPMLTSTAPYVTGAYKDIDAQDRYHLVRIEN
jgi:peptide/nickel transport system substrate-binding protein